MAHHHQQQQQGPLSFPDPAFSTARKVVENGTFTLVSQTTGRRWKAVNSSRECQFGDVWRAMELTGEAAVSSAYFAIKVRLSRCLPPWSGRAVSYACFERDTESILLATDLLMFFGRAQSVPRVAACREAPRQ